MRCTDIISLTPPRQLFFFFFFCVSEIQNHTLFTKLNLTQGYNNRVFSEAREDMPNQLANLYYVTVPPPPEYINFFEPFHFLAGDQLVVLIGASHISSWLQEIQSREWEERTNEQCELGLTQSARRGVM